ncbi:YdbH family protein [Prodigiosinella confusarubida]|uniref:YdbH family protein n=1 Tax=Serratia sp. (strain ATCC 39006) TaxID=104623 RepID=A0A2I5T7L1_SERS3|nr:YdbH family protein [Serratia sp. ATCC 39006]AUH00561.1 YdbH family protein [Serratia sp. ATCC 39006]AUH04882.1 YdbH family protein [Serratia sp. ATCC 39006]
MFKKFLLAIGLLASLVLLLITMWLSLPHWMPRLLAFWLPTGASVTIDSPPRWQKGLYLPGFSVNFQQCRFLSVESIGLHRRQGLWALAIDRLHVDATCLQYLPEADHHTPASLAQWQRRLPLADVTIHHFSLSPWINDNGALHLKSRAEQQTVDFQGERLGLLADINGQSLTLREGRIATYQGQPPVKLSGTLQLATLLNQLPVEGHLQGSMVPLQLSEPVTVALHWENNHGELTLGTVGEKTPLLILPWSMDADRIQVTNGRWHWPYGVQPVSGGVAMTLTDWQQGINHTRIEARINILTQGHNGKANAVLVLGPGTLGMVDSNLRFQLTGQANLKAVSFSASLPGILRGPVLNPTLSILPGALLRAWGKLKPDMTLEEARWPLAGITVSEAGVSGRLQAIVRVRDAYWGRSRLHFDGVAHDFWPDNGNWQWRYWGRGELLPFQGHWDIAGHGYWKDSLLEVSALSCGLDHIHYGAITVVKPRLTLAQPLRWQRDKTAKSLQMALRLVAEQVDFGGASSLPPATLMLNIKGREPDDFQWEGRLQTNDIGPVTLSGRWDGKRLRGSGWWPAQPLRVFQPLLPADWKITLRSGKFYAQTAFSAARGQGFSAGGHWVVKNAAAWISDGDVSGVNFILPYRFHDRRWQLGVKQPVTLRMGTLNNLFHIQNILMTLSGYYPYSDRYPLTLSQVDMDVLGGHISLSPLRIPQHDAAILRAEHIETSELFTVLKVKKVAMSGRVSGILPLDFTYPTTVVQHGFFTNDGALTLRLDQQLADELAKKSLTDAMAVEWLRYLEIDRFSASIDVDKQGWLLLKSHIRGKSSLRNARREVILNYHHQENIFQLWRSLRFGDNLQDALGQQLTE